MSTSPGSSLLLAVAVAEAQLTESTHLDPEHIFLALLKAEDLSAEKCGGNAAPFTGSGDRGNSKDNCFLETRGNFSKAITQAIESHRSRSANKYGGIQRTS